MVDPNQHDRFVLRQRIKLVVNQYEFFVPGEDGDEGAPICFVQQRRFKFKEDIRFYTDEAKTQELVRIKARQRFDPRATYDITAPGGEVIGTIRKVFGKSLLRSTFELHSDVTGQTVVTREQNLGVALFRRLVGFVPYLGDFADWLPIPFDFEFLSPEDQVLGLNRRRRFKWRDIYDIDLTEDPQRTLDRRLVLAACVGMDALMAR